MLGHMPLRVSWSLVQPEATDFVDSLTNRDDPNGRCAASLKLSQNFTALVSQGAARCVTVSILQANIFYSTLLVPIERQP